MLSKLTPKTFSRIAMTIAIVVAPFMTYGSAYLVYSQMDKVNAEQTQAAKPTATTKVTLSRADSEQIAANIAIADE